MGRAALLTAVAFVALASTSSARADNAAPQPCCQDTLHMFWILNDGLAKQNTWKPYVAPAAVAYTAPQPCCQDTLHMFWILNDGLAKPYAAKK